MQLPSCLAAPPQSTRLLWLLVAALGCRRPSPDVAGGALEPLPPRIGEFAGDPAEADDAAVRRSYTRGNVGIDVTIARFPMNDAEYARWVRASEDAFPQASLDLAPSDANGFYQCSEGPEPRCSLLVQLRAGVHVEIRGRRGAGRREIDALAAGLPWRALARDPNVIDRFSNRTKRDR